MFWNRKKELTEQSEQPKFRIVEYDKKFTVQELKWMPSLSRSCFCYCDLYEYNTLEGAKERLEILKTPPIYHT